MEGRRCSVAFLFLALALAAGSFAAVAELHPPAGVRYMLVAGKGNGDSRLARIALRTSGHVAGAVPAGFADLTNHWFAVTGGESLVPPGYSYGDDVSAAGQGGLDILLRVLANNGTR